VSIAIVDWRPDRRREVEDWLTGEGYSVNSASSRAHLQSCDDIDLLLLHVGDSQRREGGDLNLEEIAAEFSKRSWVLAYSGDPDSIDRFKSLNGAEFAVFPEPVDANKFDNHLKGVIFKVLKELPSRKQLPSTRFQEIVSYFDPILEWKLEALILVLSGTEPSSKCLEGTEADIPGGTINLSDPKGSSVMLRNIFFEGWCNK
jgi:CheY-like chemotaxis protein